MKLTTFTDYSLRLLIYLAMQPDQQATIAEIAAAFGVKQNHLAKVAHFLGKSGLLRTTRGKGGGLGLARAPRQIIVGDAVRLTEGAAVPAECFDRDGGNCCIAAVCHLRAALGEAVEAFYRVLDGYTLADLVENRRALARAMLVERPAVPAGAGRRAGA